MSQTGIYRLQCQTQSYDWGKLGSESKVAQFASKSGITVDPTKPYAELWMGTHPNAPSVIMDNSESLKSLIKQNPSLSTQAIYDQYNGDLPFLFKILSIRKALSIQAHPDKTLGARLFKEHPTIYKDPNHKPEMALALTPFEALCGFRPLNEIVQHLEKYPEFAQLVGSDVANGFINSVGDDKTDTDKKAALKQLFSSLMNSSVQDVTFYLSTLTSRLSQLPVSNLDTMDQLVLRLDREYPGGDVGVFSSLLLNYVVMTPGQAIFLGANEPHAYLSGDCVECMAASDNVIRAGLTPKFKDVKVLVEMLSYRYGSAEGQKMKPVTYGSHSLLYDPPIDEFSVIQTQLTSNQDEKHAPIQGPSILIVTGGTGELTGEALKTESTFTLKEGYVYFIGAGIPLNIHAGEHGLELYRAYNA
ncbi:phosphomannose isomerase type I [Halteromyces radiatus]|uniref:phosphomannose isomerase type I n=1 Tax=Halteromyces radiatus TaxID=101107 RepID=UPI00221F6F05|nr:phosphomannose isomerase type I [Halteromyces radiatus]KAI8100092.1 phosphomannose isomerase type I [Halteromyces radiatus]